MRSRTYSWLFVSVFLSAFFAQSFSAARLKSPTYDEPVHIASAVSYIQTGQVRLNPQHPPLIKELAGLSLLLGGVRWPRTSESQQALDLGGPHEWAVGNAIISENGPDRVLFWARLPMIFVATFLGLMIYIWGRRMVGEGAALGAVFLYSFDPIIIGHSALVTTDVGLAAFTILFLFAVWSYLQQPGKRRLVLCGIALGAVLLTKFSAVFLLPITAVLLLVAYWNRPQVQTQTPEPVTAKAGRNDPCPCGSGRKYKNCCGSRGGAASDRPASVLRKFTAPAIAFAAMCAIAAGTILLAYQSVDGLGRYFDGLLKVNVDHDPNYKVFMAGEMAARFPSYFAVAYLLKESLPSIILAIAGMFWLIRSRNIGGLQKLFLLLPPIVFFLTYTGWADDFGVRYIIPMLPFACLLGGLALAELFRIRAAWSRGIAIALGAWMVIASVGIYPDHLSYFNELAALLSKPNQIGIDGGSKCGTLWLDDSNVDWGQGLKQLKAWIDHNPGQEVRFRYFGSFPPEAYGIRYKGIPLSELLDPKPGQYILSGHTVARLPGMADDVRPGAGDWIRKAMPDAIIGHSLYVYTIR